MYESSKVGTFDPPWFPTHPQVKPRNSKTQVQAQVKVSFTTHSSSQSWKLLIIRNSQNSQTKDFQKETDQVYLATSYSNHGWSLWIYGILSNLGDNHGWRLGLCNPQEWSNHLIIHFEFLIFPGTASVFNSFPNISSTETARK